MPLYLHETIDIRADGSDAYLRGVLERARYSEAQGISRLVSAWQVVGSTHRWPRVINLWEMEGWAHWAGALERQFTAEHKDPHLGPWWREMVRYRRGGFDRILLPASFSPTYSDLRSSGRLAGAGEQTVYRGPAGTEDDLLEEICTTLVAIRRRRGIWLIGAYRAALRSGEVILLWAARDFATLCAEADASTTDGSWQAWRRRLARLGFRWESLWLSPAASTLLRPAPSDGNEGAR